MADIPETLVTADEIVQAAALGFKEASELKDPDQRYRSRLAFFAISRLLTTIDTPMTDARKTMAWRSYASQQYEIATGETLPQANAKLKTWYDLGRFAGEHFDLPKGYDQSDIDLARAILVQDEDIVFKP